MESSLISSKIKGVSIHYNNKNIIKNLHLIY
jgi:hypothetical protein